MNEAIKGQINDWKYGRGIIIDLLKSLTEDDLDKLLPRKQLNTIRKQCEELASVQNDYIQGIGNGTMDFSANKKTYDSTQELIEALKRLDDDLFSVVEDLNGAEKINWFGENKNIFEHLSAMIGHEQMHIGQIFAFMFAVNIDIPQTIKNIAGISD